jgi:uncharacterized protein (TIGR03437 family)
VRVPFQPNLQELTIGCSRALAVAMLNLPSAFVTAAVLAAAASLPAAGAGFRSVNLEIPYRFEENRGQSHAENRYILTHLNRGFSCAATYLYRLPTSPDLLAPVRLDNIGANDRCTGELRQPTGTRSIYLRGGTGSRRVENAHHRILALRDVWPGIEVVYIATETGYVAQYHLPTLDHIRQVRLLFTGGAPVSVRDGVLSSEYGQIRATLAQQLRQSQVLLGLEGSLVQFAPSALFSGPAVLSLHFTLSRQRGPVAGAVAVDHEHNIYESSPTRVFADDPALSCPGCWDVYLAKFDPKGELIYLVYLLGERSDSVGDIAVDERGDVYIAGVTGSRDFITTSGVLQEQHSPLPQPIDNSHDADAYLMKIRGSTAELVYSTFIGTARADVATKLEVDALGRTYLLVNSWSGEFPLKGELVQQDAMCSLTPVGPAVGELRCTYLVSLDENAATIRYSHGVTDGNLEVSPSGWAFHSYFNLGTPGGRSPHAAIQAVRPDGTFAYRVDAPEWNISSDLAVGTDDTLWLLWPAAPASGEGILSRVFPTGEVQEVSRTFRATHIFASDRRGNFWSTGPAPILPTPSAALAFTCSTCAAVTQVDATGAIVAQTYVPVLGNGMVSDGVLYIPQADMAFLVLDPNAEPGAFLVSLTDWNGNLEVSGGMLMVATGPGIGPDLTVLHPVGTDGRLATEVDGVRVFAGDLPLPIVAASRDRIVFQAPFQPFEDISAKFIVKRGESVLGVRTVGFGNFGLAPLRRPGDGCAECGIRNEDGGLNSEDHPAQPGSVLRLFVTGLRPESANPPFAHGELAAGNLPRATLTPEVRVRYGSAGFTAFATVLSFQQAPGAPAGVFELRVQLPQYSFAQGSLGPALFTLEYQHTTVPALAIIYLGTR